MDRRFVFTYLRFCAILLMDRICGHSSSVEYQLPKLRGRVRFPLSAPFFMFQCLMLGRRRLDDLMMLYETKEF